MVTELVRCSEKPMHQCTQMGTGSQRTFLRIIPAPVFVYSCAKCRRKANATDGHKKLTHFPTRHSYASIRVFLRQMQVPNKGFLYFFGFHFFSTLVPMILISSLGLSLPSRATVDISLTISCPSTTCPNTVYEPSKCGVPPMVL